MRLTNKYAESQHDLDGVVPEEDGDEFLESDSALSHMTLWRYIHSTAQQCKKHVSFECSRLTRCAASTPASPKIEDMLLATCRATHWTQSCPEPCVCSRSIRSWRVRNTCRKPEQIVERRAKIEAPGGRGQLLVIFLLRF